ncbi:MAG: NOP5/NOP56 family protein, partial [Candidatus Nanohaloarchaea archaeon]|nr:NOP5/NOP56 family protein [Candidatus Nanohaloarchaea archaeon]
MQLAKTVAGIYVLDGDEVVDSQAFDGDDLPGALEKEQPLEEEYSDAERTVLSTDRLADLSGLSPAEIRDRQRSAALALTDEALADAGGRDQLLVQAVRALDDLDEVNNELAERLRPWYAQHFPELDDAVGDHERFADIVADTADRDAMDDHQELAADSTGRPLTGEDAAMLERFAGYVRDGHELRDAVEEYVAGLADEVAPNLSAVLGPVLAARVIALAGSLEDLAKMPSSTVQVLGAEEAMFRHVRGEGDAPKHGVLFMHEHVRNAPQGAQGKMARVLANKASIAARLDN